MDVNPELHELDQALIPEDFYGNLQDPGGWELWIDGVKRFSCVARRDRSAYRVGRTAKKGLAR